MQYQNHPFKMNSFVVKLSFCLLLFSKLTFGQETLEYNLNIGDSLMITQEATQDIIQDMNGSKHEMSNDLEYDFNLVVTAKTDSSYLINFSFKRLKIRTTSNIYGELLNVDTDTELKEADLEAKTFAGLTHNILKMEMLKTGKIVKITGAENMIRKMVNMSEIEDEFTKEIMFESIKKEYGNESLARNIEQMTYCYPNKKVSVEDQWTNSFSGNHITTNVWTLEEINKNIVLNAKSEVCIVSEENSYIMKLKGTQDSEVIANKTSGFPELITVNSITKGTTVMDQGEDLEIPTTIISKTTYKIKKYVQ